MTPHTERLCIYVGIYMIFLPSLQQSNSALDQPLPQLLLPHIKLPVHSESWSQSPSPRSQGFSWVQQFMSSSWASHLSKTSQNIK